ncbi:hypothetical protein GLOTRDRAFT_63247 [Gloeophyllum trabeum ATCC 11539]|uniref:MYND-type domain-containing protein n=1 Tax=Gloeophyllum trabeum (strain ATCC 11539 / FP-39264 / Madison 617) TaxID=670483 RepID=S7Q111_GLOTA|nr:uncharacterized protein GLOTRDRAFT_63247 [Gloeophyllum trabeum ATCC 11539]EPQ53631.1 hypothetical protein GLOTRDRAFT_63247 [Gloeophyllum trabeum ATCC 11539]
MPGPGKSKSKAKTKTTRTKSPAQTYAREAFVDDIDQSEGWDTTVHILCEHFQLPDLTTRNGLKKVHANFDEVYRRLDEAYKNNQGNERVLGGIIGIWAKMCADSILRDKLFRAGFLTKLIPLLYVPACRHLALRALSTVTHHGGVESRIEIAKKTPALLEVIHENPDDAKVAELCLVVMCHSIAAVVAVEQKPDPKILKTIDIPQVLRTTVGELRNPRASYYLISHAAGLLSGATMHSWKDYKAFQPALTFLVAVLRVKDINIRCEGLCGVIRYHNDIAEPDQRHSDPQKMLAALRRGFPPHLNDVLMAYGPTRCDVYLTLQCMNEHTKAMMQNAQDRDFYKLGRVVARLITTTEFSMTEGMFQSDEETGKRVNIDLGLPYTMWSDALPHCAQALRSKGDLDQADIVELKYMIMKGRIPQAVELSKQAIKRNPEVAYFYYAITMTADMELGLRYAKKGLKARQITPFVRFGLLHRAVDHAGTLAIRILTSPDGYHGERKWEEGVAFLTSALEDAKTFIENAPPDSRHMKNMLNWYIILTLTIKGPDMSPEMKELDDALKKLQVAEECSAFCGHPIPNTELRLTRRALISLYPSAVQEWGDVVRRFDEQVAAHEDVEELLNKSKEEQEDDLAAWLDDLHLDNGERDHPHKCSHPKVNVNSVSLYRCSWCGNPSAVLRKCGGCNKARYCDAGCQKSHWSTHKSVCKSA